MEGPVAFDDVLAIADEFVAAGVAGIALCDTTGMANPVQIRASCAGLANVLAGLDAGIDRHGLKRPPGELRS